MNEQPKKLQLILKRHVKPWDFYNDPQIKDASNRKNLLCLQKLNKGLGFPTDRFHFKRFDSESSFKLVCKFLFVDNAFAPQTRRAYAFALKKALQQTPTDFSIKCFNLYADLATHLHIEADRLRATKPDISFSGLKEKFESIINDASAVSAVRIICIFLYYNIGAFRPSDLQNTRLMDDHQHSFLDLRNGYWYIRADFTKNKSERRVDIPEGAVNAIKGILPKDGNIYLLLNKRGEQYTDITSLTGVMKRAIGFGFNEIRSGYVQEIHRNESTTIAEATETAERIGHSLRTANQHYNQ
jgi:hypothetical protein